MIKIENKLIQVDRFPDGTQNIKFPSFTVTDNISLTWLYDDDSEMFTLMCVVNWLNRKGINSNHIILNLPYVPNARMDRIIDINENFSLKVFCNFINSFKFCKVFTESLHSNVGRALINNCIDLSTLYPSISLDTYDIVFYPDEGAYKRYKSNDCILRFDHVTVAFGVKDRDWKTGEIKSLQIVGCDDFTNKKVLIFDDICSYGGTFFRAGQELRKLGASKVDLFVYHCENSIEKGNLLKDDSPIDHIYTTDSIYTGHSNKITVITNYRHHD